MDSFYTVCNIHLVYVVIIIVIVVAHKYSKCHRRSQRCVKYEQAGSRQNTTNTAGLTFVDETIT